MTDALLNALKLVLLALIYLFFGRVLWAVWSEVRTPVMPSPSSRTGRNKTTASKGVPTFVVIATPWPHIHIGERSENWPPGR